MTSPASTFGKPIQSTPEMLMRHHIAEMRRYASDLEKVLGVNSPIVKRIRVCAKSNEDTLDCITRVKCQVCGQETPA